MTVGTLSSMIPRIFDRAWRRYGRPLLAAVKPIADWALPAGFAYNNELDVIEDVSGNVITNPEDYWTVDYIHIVPSGHDADMRIMAAAGQVPAGIVFVTILAADVDTMRNAHSAQINGLWYDVDDVGPAPVGYGGNAVWASVRLRRRS